MSYHPTGEGSQQKRATTSNEVSSGYDAEIASLLGLAEDVSEKIQLEKGQILGVLKKTIAIIALFTLSLLILSASAYFIHDWFRLVGEEEIPNVVLNLSGATIIVLGVYFCCNLVLELSRLRNLRKLLQVDQQTVQGIIGKVDSLKMGLVDSVEKDVVNLRLNRISLSGSRGMLNWVLGVGNDKDGEEGFDLRLMSVTRTNDLEDQGRSLLLVALVGNDLYIRIFDANGKKIVDKPENELIAGQDLTRLKKLVRDSSGNVPSLSQAEKQRAIEGAKLIAGMAAKDRY